MGSERLGDQGVGVLRCWTSMARGIRDRRDRSCKSLILQFLSFVLIFHV